MTNLVLWACLLAVMLSAHAGAVTEPGAASHANRILVMVQAPAPHYAPGAPNALGYGSAGGRMRAAKAARAIARKHGLTVVEGWPMSALGVHCFLLQSPHQDLAALLARLAADSRVESVQTLQIYRSRNDVRVGLSYALDSVILELAAASTDAPRRECPALGDNCGPGIFFEVTASF